MNFLSQFKKYNKSRNKGFTLIEVMIASGLFVVIMVLGISAVMNTSLTYKKSQSQRSALDSMAFIVEDMSRIMRTGSAVNCNPDLINILSIETPGDCYAVQGNYPPKRIAIEDFEGIPGDINDQVVYKIEPDGIYRSDNSGGVFFKLTPDSITMDLSSGFIVRGSEPQDGQQPIIFIHLTGKIEDTIHNFVTPFNYQLAITPRRIDS